MNVTPKIRLRDNTPGTVWIRPDWLEGDYLYLDIDSEFSLSLSKEVMTLTDINKITTEGVVDTSLPATGKNLAILRPSMDIERIDNTYPEYNIDVEIGHRVLRQSNLRVTGYDRATNRIDIEITDNSDNWIEAIKNIYLDELDFGTFEYSPHIFYDNWANYRKYLDGDHGVYMGHCFYGKYFYPNTLVEGDFRPLVHALAVVQKGFKAAGWAVTCPILETEKGRTILSYVLKSDFLKDPDTLKGLEFKSGYTSKINLFNTQGKTRKLVFPVEYIDNGLNFDNTTGVFDSAGIFDFAAELNANIGFEPKSTFGKGSLIFFQIVQEYTDGTKIVLNKSTEYRNDLQLAYKNERITLVASNIIVRPGEKIYVEYAHSGPDVTKGEILNGSLFYNTPISKIIETGDVITIADQLRHDSFLDYLKGIAHLFKIMFYTDWSNNTVYMLTPYDLDFFGNSVEGFYSQGTKDFRPKQIHGTEKYIQKEKTTQNRIYSFKQSTDAKIKSYDWDKYEPYSRFIDNGFDWKIDENNEVFENPYFEPTFSADTGLGLHGAIIEAPWLVDNLDNQLSNNIAPRILIGHSYGPVYYEKVFSGNTSYSISTFSLWSGKQKQIPEWINLPIVSQKQNQATGISGVFPNQTKDIPTFKLTYGWHEDDLYQLIYKKYERDNRDLPRMTFEAVCSPEDYFGEHFRKRAVINSPDIHTGEVSGRIISITDYNPESGTAQFTFIPDNQTLNDCIGFEVPLSCENYPKIKITQVGQIFTISVNGSMTSGIQSTVIKYKYVDAVLWTTGSVIDTPLKNVDLNILITFDDGCRPITLNGLIIRQLKPSIGITKIGNKVTAQEIGVHELTVSDTEIFFSQDGVNNWQKYEAEIDISRWTNSFIYFRTIVTYDTGDKAEAEEVFTVAPAEGECPDPDAQQYPPIVSYAKTAQGYTLYKSGDINGDVGKDDIYFREKNKNQDWALYEVATILPLGKCYQFRRCIQWCNSECPIYCTAIGETDCGTCTGTLLSISESVSYVTCSMEQKYEHPTSAGVNKWAVVPVSDSIDHVPEVRTWIERNCGGTISEITNKSIIWDRWNFRTEFIYTWNTGYKLKEINVHKADSLGIGANLMIPLDIIYTSGDDNSLLEEAIKERIRTYLSVNEDLIEEINYKLWITVTGTSTKTLNLGFVAKHNPVNTWIGIRLGVDVMNIEAPDTSISSVNGSGKEFQLTTTTAPILENWSVYGTQFKIRFRISTVDYFLDDSASNFNLFVPLSNPAILTDTLSTVLTDTGKKFTLSASLPGCSGTPTWKWLYGGVKKYLSGKTIGYTSSQEVYVGATIDVMILATCPTATYCTYEKLIKLTV